jgi:excisionase family DNA binding protein
MSKVIPISPGAVPERNDDMIVTLRVSQLRALIREEVAAANGNGHQPKLLYSTKEAADLCGVPESWLASAARSGKVKSRHLGNYVRFSLDDLKDLIEKAAKDFS